MHIDRDALYREWEPKVKQMADAKVRRLQRAGGELVDANAIEGAAVSALKRAVDQWQGAGEFEAYLRRAVRNAWAGDARQERRHRHAAYPSCNDDEPHGEFAADGTASPGVYRQARSNRPEGNSPVLAEVIRREFRAAFARGGLPEAMRLMGFPEDEMAEYVRRKNRNVQQHDRRHPDNARQRFNQLFAS